MKRSNERGSAILYRVPPDSFEALSADEITEEECPRVGTINDEPFSGYSSDLSQPMPRDSNLKCDHVSAYPSTANASSSAHRDYVGKTKGKKTKPSDIKSKRDERSRRKVIMIASGWTEVFTTITEEPTTEEMIINVPSLSSKQSSLKTSTLGSKSTVIGSSTEAPAMTSEEPTATTAESTSGEHPFGTLEPMPQRGLLRGLAPYSSMYHDPLENAWSGSQSTRLYLDRGSTLEDTIEELRSSRRDTSETASPIWRIQLQNIAWIRRVKRQIVDTFGMFVNILSSAIAPGTWANRTDMTSSIEPFGLDEASYEWKGDERTPFKPYREPFHPSDVSDNSVSPERGSLLVLTVGLLVATFVIASLLFVRFRYQTQLPQESAPRYFHWKMNINGTLFVEKSRDTFEKATTAVEEAFNEKGGVSPMATTAIDET